jgi:hypothetical protein
MQAVRTGGENAQTEVFEQFPEDREDFENWSGPFWDFQSTGLSDDIFRDLPKRHTRSGHRGGQRASRGGMVEMERDEERSRLVSGGMGVATSGRAANRRPLLIVASIAMVTLLAVCATQMREPAGTVRTPHQHHLRSGVKIIVAVLLHDAQVALRAVARGMVAARPLSFH